MPASGVPAALFGERFAISRHMSAWEGMFMQWPSKSNNPAKLVDRAFAFVRAAWLQAVIR